MSKPIYRWCYQTATLPPCPYLGQCKKLEKAINPELCLERYREFMLYKKYDDEEQLYIP